MKKVLAVATAAAAVIGLSACSTSIPAGSQAVKVDDYFMIPADPTVEGCIKPETNEFNPPGGFKAYLYPSRQISYDANDDKDAEAPTTVVVSNASNGNSPAELKVPVTVTFDLTKDCDKLKDFHRNFGTKYQGWLNDDGSVSDGWKNLLNYVVGQPLKNTLVSIGQKYPWQQIWNDDKVRGEFQAALTETLPRVSKERTNGVEYFSNFQVTVMKPDVVNADLKNAIVAQQTAIQQAQATQAKGVADAEATKAKAVADAEAAKAKATADIEAAKAQTELARQRALQQQAEISGYPDVESYIRAKAVDKGFTLWPQPILGFPGSR